jgi:hypothetical protein
MTSKNKQMNEALYDPDLPNANSVMASLCCVAAQYASNPSLALAELAADLSHKLTAPQYAESRLVTEVAKRLVAQWDAILHEQNGLVASVMPASRMQH